ncbi:zinc/manganese transport system permease protein [Kitasatospora sp. MAP12-15]|uniref:metal ABC transporter permease n=1 Tax=unclassified Kitasatospora TaxID=2633591 RepID=UPI002474AEF8|nr:metal ABC transporter permease [Kitasatospora sp. MAP12-44]MDH6108587.1 zinc/manganese transport system permease protein [Kitasatospora sp. MAP12-44]
MLLASDAASPIFSWNLIADFQDICSYLYMVNAFRAGLVVSVVCAVVGWFMVLRRQTFAGHTLSVAAFPGAALATLAGFSLTLGYFGFCVGAALVIAALGRKGRESGAEESAVTGTVQAFALACGFLFISLYKGLLEGPTALLFGDFLGITTGQVLVLAIAGVLVLAVLALIGRPLLFASIDPEVAAGRGVPVRLLGAVFLVLLGAATAEASEMTGTLLVFALMVIPAATAQQLTARPALSMLLAVLLALGACWAGLVAAYYQPYPLGFFVTGFAFTGYVLAHLLRWAREAWGRRAAPPGSALPAIGGTV